MSVLLVGFDSAWTRKKAGAIAGALLDEAGAIRELGAPRLVRFEEATSVIAGWQIEHRPSSTLVLIDQPTIVENQTGQRPVERIVCSVVSRRRGGMQPAYKGRVDMFGTDATIWAFLDAFGRGVDPFDLSQPTRIIETYPVLATIAFGWMLVDPDRSAGRLPKYNPARRKTFSLEDWTHVFRQVAGNLRANGAKQLAEWVQTAACKTEPVKSDQDQLDACICLIVAIHLAKSRDALLVGNRSSGYIVVPHSQALRHELAIRCDEIGHAAMESIQQFRFDEAVMGPCGT